MKCPRDNAPLKEITISDVALDLCESCGGVWFDNFEIKAFDEKHEGGEELLALMSKHGNPDVNLEARLNSPRHPEIVMQRRFWSPARMVEIDVCPRSGGMWLDGGELAQIRSLFDTDADRKEAVRKMVAEAVNNSELPAMQAKSQENLATTRKMVSLIRWLCPSQWRPDDQG